MSHLAPLSFQDSGKLPPTAVYLCRPSPTQTVHRHQWSSETSTSRGCFKRDEWREAIYYELLVRHRSVGVRERAGRLERLHSFQEPHPPQHP